MIASPVLRARGLTRVYPVARGWWQPPVRLTAIEDVSFTLPAAGTLAVVGESGCGKSTLGRLTALVEPPTSGRLTLAGVDVATATGATRRRLRRAVQMVFQNPFASLNPRQTIERIVGEPLAIAGELPRRERRARVRQMLQRVGLGGEHAQLYPHMLSGGQRQRVAIARALILQPRLVVADEPTSALDLSIQAQVLNLLRDLQEEFGVAYLFISHDLPLVRHLAQRLLVLYLGRVAERGPADAIFRRPRHPYTQALLAAAPGLHAPGSRRARLLPSEPPSPLDPPPGCAFHGRCPHATSRCAAERPALRYVDGRLVACHFAERIAVGD